MKQFINIVAAARILKHLKPGLYFTYKARLSDVKFALDKCGYEYELEIQRSKKSIKIYGSENTKVVCLDKFIGNAYDLESIQ